MVFGMLQGLVLIAAAMFWIFVLWMIWKVVQGLAGIDQTLKDIANSLRQRSGKSSSESAPDRHLRHAACLA